MIYTGLLGLSSAVILCFNVMVLLKGSRSRVNRSFSFFGFCVFIWLASFFAGYLVSSSIKVLLFKVGYIGIVFLPATFFYFVGNYLDFPRWHSLWAFAISGVFCALNFSPYPLFSELQTFFWGAYPKARVPAHALFLVYFIAVFTYCAVRLFISCFLSRSFQSASLQNQRKKYILFGTLIGTMGCLDFLPNYGIAILPIGFIFMIAYPAILFYAIVKYRLMDITIALTRTSLFIAVYALVLGLPFVVAFGFEPILHEVIGARWWLAPLILLTVLATAGPFIYLAIQKRTEEKFFSDQKRYRETLRQAATGMGRIKDMKRLLDMIVRLVTSSVRVEHSFIYLKDTKGKNFYLAARRFRSDSVEVVKDLPHDSPVVRAILHVRAPIVYSEIKQRAQDFDDEKLASVGRHMEELKGELLVPCFIEEKLIAIMVMGKKASGELFSQDDLSVFMILSGQAGLAIENAEFYREMRATHEQLFRAEKMATIGIMADGLSHQINNRLHALGFIAGDALDTLQLKKNIKMSDEVRDIFVDIEHALTRIQENVTQGGEIVRGLLKYSRKSDEGFQEVDLDDLLDDALKMAEFKIKGGEMSVLRDFDPALPKIYGNFAQLQEVFFNMIDNAYDAMMQRKTDLKEEGYRPTIRIRAERARRGALRIVLEDNGIGIKAEDQEKIFTPFFTTKLSSKKGTGLGLYVIQKLIEENHKGRVVYKSEYAVGTKIYITLPTVEERVRRESAA